MEKGLLEEREVLLYNAASLFDQHDRVDLIEKHNLEDYVIEYKIDPTAEELKEYLDKIGNLCYSEVQYDKESKFPIIQDKIGVAGSYRNLLHRLCEIEEFEICDSLKSIRDNITDSFI